MISFSKDLTIEYSSSDMYNVVFDVKNYPSFLPYCRSLTVIEELDEQLRCEMMVSYGPFLESFTSTTFGNRERQEIRTVSNGQKFQTLETMWRFQDVANGCQINFSTKYELRKRLHQVLIKSVAPLFHEMMIEAFIRRARDVYGNRNSSAQSIPKPTMPNNQLAK